MRETAYTGRPLHQIEVAINGGLVGAQVERLDMRGKDVSGANFDNANFRGADLTDANLEGCSLVKVDFSRACLLRANLKGTTCVGADFTQAYLRATNFTGANLRNSLLKRVGAKGAIYCAGSFWARSSMALRSTVCETWIVLSSTGICQREAGGRGTSRTPDT